MIDIHSHVLPGVDDGSTSLEESREMFQRFAGLGYTRLVATPHWAVGVPDVAESIVDSTRAVAAESGIQLSLARECRIHPNFLDHIRQNPRLRVDGGNVVLVELPWGSTPIFTIPVFQSLLKAGLRPVLVHPERHAPLWEQGSPLNTLVRNGVLLQVNVQSFTGQYGDGARDRAISLLESGMVTLVASDLHAANELRTSMPEALSLLENLIGKEATAILTTKNPDALLSNRQIQWPGEVEVDTSWIRRDRGFLGRLMGLMRGAD